MSSFAARLRSCGVGTTIRPAEFARKCAVSSNTVSLWINDKSGADNIKAAPLLRAAAILEVNPMWLLTGSGRREPASPTVITVEQPRGTYSNWPFERVPPEKYYALPQEIRTGIQMMIDGVLLGATFPPTGGSATGTHG